MDSENIWGGVISSEDQEEDDPIKKEIDILNSMISEKVEVLPGESLDQVKERRSRQLAEQEKKIWDMIYTKKQKDMFK